MLIELENITKSYGRKKALDDLSVKLSPGIYALLGPNGAGKSTLMNILTGNLKSDRGCIRHDGKTVTVHSKEYKEILGYMPQQQALYPEFTAWQFLDYVALLRGMKKKEAETAIDQALKVVELDQVAHGRIGTFSGGMKQRLLLAQALMHDPKLLILDEPTAGLDPKQRIAVRNIIAQASKDRIVLIATHIVQDVECIANRIILLSEGKILCQKDYGEILEGMRGLVWEISGNAADYDELRDAYKVAGLRQEQRA